ncbi:MAG: DUF4369 domain-containing protein [Candidatus Cryptobacteroides sp.]
MKQNMNNLKSIAKIAAFAAFLAFAVSCSDKAVIKGSLKGASDSDVIVKLLNINRYEVLDTIKTDASGKFSYKMAVKEGQPEFVYLFHGDTKIASLLLEKGDKVVVDADTLGQFSVTGSEETSKLISVEKDFADFSSSFLALSDRYDAVSPESSAAKEIKREMGAEYVNYYRKSMRYVLENPYSLTVIPVFFQYVSPTLPVFSQETDAIYFSNVCDSLQTVYPDSRYVKSLRAEADRRMNILKLGARIRSAESLGFPDLDLPDVKGTKTKLSSVDAKVILLHFWTASDATQKMFNLDVLEPVYRDYHSKGLEIYQVAIDVDKAGWARAVRDQKLEWINVCDGYGTSSPVVGTYNLSTLPVTFVIADGKILDEKVKDEKSLRALLNKLL